MSVICENFHASNLKRGIKNLNIAIILAAGIGERLGFEFPKQFLKFAGKTCLEHVLDAFSKHPKIHHLIIVCHENYLNFVQNLTKNYTQISIIKGGTTRQFSTLNALKFIKENFENSNLNCASNLSNFNANSAKFSQNFSKFSTLNLKNLKPKIKVLIHDAARPLLDERIISDCLDALLKYKAVDVAVNASDTIIEAKKTIIKIPNRAQIFYGQTPQCFDFKALLKAYEKALKIDKNLSDFSDDCGLFLRYSKHEIFVVRGSFANHKLTRSEDIAFIDRLFAMKNLNLYGKFNFKSLENKVFVVFGGNSGIGLQICKIASKFGAKTHAFSRTNNVDVCDINAINYALNFVFKKHGKIDCVINMAGILQKAPLIKMSQSEIAVGISVNFTANFSLAKAAFSYLKKSGGMLILTSSSSYSRGRENYALYSSCKAGLVNFAQAIADEFIKDGVKVNVLAPSRTRTLMREVNFGKENTKSLLSPKFVAQQCLKLYLKNTTGELLLVNKPQR